LKSNGSDHFDNGDALALFFFHLWSLEMEMEKMLIVTRISSLFEASRKGKGSQKR
jgi:hypothetical protein